MNYNKYETYDNYFYLGVEGPSTEGEFHDVGEVLNGEVKPTKYNGNAYFMAYL